MTEMTTSLVKKIRQMRAAGIAVSTIAAELGINRSTARIYCCDNAIADRKKYERERYLRERLDPVKSARRRAQAIAYRRMLREAMRKAHGDVD